MGPPGIPGRESVQSLGVGGLLPWNDASQHPGDSWEERPGLSERRDAHGFVFVESF